jgi:hypothetical protein
VPGEPKNDLPENADKCKNLAVFCSEGMRASDLSMLDNNQANRGGRD